MEAKGQIVKFYRLDAVNCAAYREKFIDLYLHAFTRGRHAQAIVPEMVERLLDDLLCDGLGILALDGDRLVGWVAAFPLNRETDFPREKYRDVVVAESLYISEVMVHEDYRGRGIATRMIGGLLREAERDYSYAVIRVWQENRPAMVLYRKLGFVPLGVISQIKMNAAGEEFEMEKVYLGKQMEIRNHHS